MKKKVYLIGIMLWALSCFWGCSDDDDVVPKGMLQIYGREYHLTSGVIWQNNPNVIASTVPYVWEDKYENEEGEEVLERVEGFETGEDRMETGNFLLSLYENGLVFNEMLESAKGKAACVCFHLASSNTNRLVPGKYVFDESRRANTFSGYCSSEYNTQGDVKPAAFSAGEVVVEEAGEEYHIVFRCETTFGGKISGEYLGKLDFCRVSQVSFSEYTGVALSGLMDEVSITEGLAIPGLEELETYTIIDEDCGNAFFSLTSGIAQTANVARRNKEVVDLSLIYNEVNESFSFESPIRMRAKLGHQSKYDFPCHTIYMKAPENFTDADFENLSSDSFSSYEITEEEVIVPTQDFKPMYVFFQTGKGVQGVIKIYGHTPLGSRVVIEYGVYRTVFTVNPALLLEIKCPAVVANPQIR